MTRTGAQAFRSAVTRAFGLFVAIWLVGVASATAQESGAVPQPTPLVEPPIAPYVVDVRGLMANFKRSNDVATNVGLADSAALPGRGFGFAVGAHVYPLRLQRFAIGVGADLILRARGSETQDPAVEEGPDGPTVVTKMTAFSPQVSLNFGKRNGWSYLSVGMGPSSLVTELEEDPMPDAETNPRALNYGGGARWFATKHVAFTFDIRFYSINAQEATASRPAYPKVRMTILSAGVSFR